MKTLYIIAGCNGAGKTTANLFEIYMPLVDSWRLVENQSNPRIIIAENSVDGVDVHNDVLFNKVKAYVN